MIGRQQGSGDEQGLGLGGVLDLVGVGRRAEVEQIDPGKRGPPAKAGLRTIKGEPRSQEAGLLSTLARRENGEHVTNPEGSRPAMALMALTKSSYDSCGDS